MKIGVAATGLGHVTRGIETWAGDVARALVGRGEDVVLFKGAGEPAAPYERVVRCWRRDEKRTGRVVRTLSKVGGWRMGLGSVYGVEQATFALKLLPMLRREGVDVLHVQDPHLARIVQRARAMGIVKTKAILGHGTEEPIEFLKGIEYLQHLAPWHLEEARREGAWRETWTAIPNFVDTDVFSPVGGDLRQELGIPQDGLVVLTAAAIKREHKRVDYLIEEFARLRAERPELPAWLVVAGGWESETDELVRIGTEKLGERIRFLVRFPRERMPSLYRSADVFTLCSLKEMMPIALLEAAGSGRPCVVNRHPVMEWMVGPGGEAIDMDKPGALCASLSGLLGDGARRRGLGEAARRYCVENFGRDRVVDQILGYYQRVMAGGGADGRVGEVVRGGHSA